MQMHPAQIRQELEYIQDVLLARNGAILGYPVVNRNPPAIACKSRNRSEGLLRACWYLKSMPSCQRGTHRECFC